VFALIGIEDPKRRRVRSEECPGGALSPPQPSRLGA
jgi:hypothetical protein